MGTIVLARFAEPRGWGGREFPPREGGEWGWGWGGIPGTAAPEVQGLCCTRAAQLCSPVLLGGSVGEWLSVSPGGSEHPWDVLWACALQHLPADACSQFSSPPPLVVV